MPTVAIVCVSTLGAVLSTNCNPLEIADSTGAILATAVAIEVMRRQAKKGSYLEWEVLESLIGTYRAHVDQVTDDYYIAVCSAVTEVPFQAPRMLACAKSSLLAMGVRTAQEVQTSTRVFLFLEELVHATKTIDPSRMSLIASKVARREPLEPVNDLQLTLCEYSRAAAGGDRMNANETRPDLVLADAHFSYPDDQIRDAPTTVKRPDNFAQLEGSMRAQGSFAFSAAASAADNTNSNPTSPTAPGSGAASMVSSVRGGGSAVAAAAASGARRVLGAIPTVTDDRPEDEAVRPQIAAIGPPPAAGLARVQAVAVDAAQRAVAESQESAKAAAEAAEREAARKRAATQQLDDVFSGVAAAPPAAQGSSAAVSPRGDATPSATTSPPAAPTVSPPPPAKPQADMLDDIFGGGPSPTTTTAAAAGSRRSTPPPSAAASPQHDLTDDIFGGPAPTPATAAPASTQRPSTPPAAAASAPPQHDMMDDVFGGAMQQQQPVAATRRPPAAASSSAVDLDDMFGGPAANMAPPARAASPPAHVDRQPSSSAASSSRTSPQQHVTTDDALDPFGDGPVAQPAARTSAYQQDDDHAASSSAASSPPASPHNATMVGGDPERSPLRHASPAGGGGTASGAPSDAAADVGTASPAGAAALPIDKDSSDDDQVPATAPPVLPAVPSAQHTSPSRSPARSPSPQQHSPALSSGGARSPPTPTAGAHDAAMHVDPNAAMAPRALSATSSASTYSSKPPTSPPADAQRSPTPVRAMSPPAAPAAAPDAHHPDVEPLASSSSSSDAGTSSAAAPAPPPRQQPATVTVATQQAIDFIGTAAGQEQVRVNETVTLSSQSAQGATVLIRCHDGATISVLDASRVTLDKAASPPAATVVVPPGGVAVQALKVTALVSSRAPWVPLRFRLTPTPVALPGGMHDIITRIDYAWNPRLPLCDTLTLQAHLPSGAQSVMTRPANMPDNVRIEPKRVTYRVVANGEYAIATDEPIAVKCRVAALPAEGVTVAGSFTAPRRIAPAMFDVVVPPGDAAVVVVDDAWHVSTRAGDVYRVTAPLQPE